MRLFGVTYSLQGQWSNGNWTYSGNETGTNSANGYLGVGGAGTYTQTTLDDNGSSDVTGTTSVNDSTVWSGNNARYPRCRLVQDLAAVLGIELLFLPAYSPDLDLIERLGLGSLSRSLC